MIGRARPPGAPTVAKPDNFGPIFAADQYIKRALPFRLGCETEQKRRESNCELNS